MSLSQSCIYKQAAGDCGTWGGTQLSKSWQNELKVLALLTINLLSSHLFSAWVVFSSSSSILNTCSDTPPRSEILLAEVKGMVELQDTQKDNESTSMKM